MALKIGSLYVSLTANSTGLVKGFADASKAAERVARDIKRASAEVAQVAGTFAMLGAAAVKLASSVDGPTKQAMDGLERSSKVLAVQIADMLLPAVREVSAMFQTAARAVAGLSPETKQAISTIAVLAVQLAVAGKAMSMVAGLSSNLLGALRAVSSVIVGIGVGPLLNIGIAVGGVIALVILLHRAWRKNWGGIQEATQSVLEWLRGAFGQLADFFGGVWNFLVDGAAGFVEMLLKVGDAVEKMTGKSLGIAGLREGFAGMWKDLKSGSFFSEAFTFGKSVGQQVVDGLSDELANIKKELGLDKLFSGMTGGKPIGLGRGMAGLQQQQGAIVSGAVSQFGGGISISDSDTRAQGAEWLREMERAAKAMAAQEDAQTQALQRRLAIADALDKQQRVAAAVRTGTVGGLAKPLRDEANKQMDQTTDAAVGASSWGSAMKTLETGLQGSMTAGRVLSVWGQRMAGIIGSAGKQILGAVGDLVGSIVDGAQAGGVWGAIIAAFMEIAKKTASALKFLDVAMNFVQKLAEMVEPLVAPIFDALTDVLAGVLNAVGPLFAALQPLFDAVALLIEELLPVFDALGYVIQAVAPIIEVIGKLVGVIVKGLKPIIDILAGVLKVIATVVLGIIIALNEIASALGDEAAKAESNRLKGIIDKMWDPNSQEQDDAARANTRATLENTAATEANTASAREQLTNIPTGYKLALARFNSDMGISSQSAFASAAGGGGTTINGDIYLTTQSPETLEQLADDARREGARERGQQRGNPSRGRNPRD